MSNATSTAATTTPRWGKGFVPADPRTRYRAALDSYRRAEKATYGTEIDAKAFAADCKGCIDATRPLEVVVAAGDDEFVTERAIDPVEWAEAAERVAGRFCDSYTVRNTLRPDGDWEWEQTQRANGLAW